MANTNPSANMTLPIPAVGVDPGPDYATNINSCFTLLDAHTHSIGSGVQITPSALNISSDLSFGSNNATLLRSTRFSAQNSLLAGASDLGCLYVSGVDLYYNDGSGNQVRVTQSGGIAGSPGSIANLTSPASASYVSGNATFVWQSDSNTSANLDAASVILRNLSAGSYGLTLSPPPLPSNYTITLPTLPATTAFLRMLTSGVFTADLALDDVTITSNVGVIFVKNRGITSDKIATATITNNEIAPLTILASNIGNAAITNANLGTSIVFASNIAADTIVAGNIAPATITGARIAAATITGGAGGNLALNTVNQNNRVAKFVSNVVGVGGFAISSSCGAYSTGATGYTTITNLTVTITTAGGPVALNVIPDGSGNSFLMGGNATPVGFQWVRDATAIRLFSGGTVNSINQSLTAFDNVGAGSHTYYLQVLVGIGTLNFEYAMITAYEM